EDFKGNMVPGNGLDEQTLRRAGAEGADCFAAVTNGDNRNLMAAQIAKEVFGIGRVITRVYDPIRAEVYRDIGLETICSTVIGAGDEMSFLATTGIERADVVVAATGDDEDNLVACQLAKRKFNVPRTIARVSDPRHVKLFRAVGIDVPVSATELLMGLIEAEL